MFSIFRWIIHFFKDDIVARYGLYAFIFCLIVMLLWREFIPFVYAPMVVFILFPAIFLIMSYGAYKERNPGGIV